MTEDLIDKRVLVTGGSMGIGLAVSRMLAELGARVIVAARRLDAVDAAVAGLSGSGHLGLSLDVGDETQWADAIQAIDSGGSLDGLVTAAGALEPVGPLEDVSIDAIRRTIEVNLIGTMLALHHAIPRLRRSKGRAVTFSGGGATSPLPRFDAYAASKAAVVRLTENLATRGEIALNAVAPGFVATAIHQATLRAGVEAAGQDYFDQTVAQLDAGGFPATEAAELVCFLLSAQSSGISGRLISAQWDPWREPSFRERLRSDPTLATLRRIDGQFFSRL